MHHHSVLSHQHSVKLLPAPKLSTRCILMLPATALSWHQLSLPPKTLGKGQAWLKGQQPRLRSVLEGMLEDQVLEDPAQLHFALQPNAQDGHPVWLAICQRDWLRETLSLVRAAGYVIDSIIPELAPATDSSSTQACLCGEPENAYWLWNDASGVHQRPWQTHQPAPWTRGLHTPPQIVRAEAAMADLAATSLGQTPDIQSHAQRLQSQIATPWNLAQFDLALDTSWDKRILTGLGQWWKAPKWRPLRWALVGLLFIQLIGLQLYVWRSQSILQQQRSAINRVLTETFPKTLVIVDAPAQMQKAVQALQQASGMVNSTDLEGLLSAWGQAVQGSPAAQRAYAPSGLRYSNGQVEIINSRPWASDVSADLQPRLRSLGIEAQFQSNSVQLRPLKATSTVAP